MIDRNFHSKVGFICCFKSQYYYVIRFYFCLHFKIFLKIFLTQSIQISSEKIRLRKISISGQINFCNREKMNIINEDSRISSVYLHLFHGCSAVKYRPKASICYLELVIKRLAEKHIKSRFGLKCAYPFDIRLGLVITICHLRDTSSHLIWKPYFSQMTKRNLLLCR